RPRPRTRGGAGAGDGGGPGLRARGRRRRVRARLHVDGLRGRDRGRPEAPPAPRREPGRRGVEARRGGGGDRPFAKQGGVSPSAETGGGAMRTRLVILVALCAVTLASGAVPTAGQDGAMVWGDGLPANLDPHDPYDVPSALIQ